MREEHYLYVMAKKTDDVGLTGPVKVGISGDPRKRLSTIQTSCPFPIAIAWVFRCPDSDIARQMESMFHETQGDKHLHGEWFDYAPSEAIALMCLAFRVALRSNLSGDAELIEECLQLCGVHHAERVLKLPIIATSEVSS